MYQNPRDSFIADPNRDGTGAQMWAAIVGAMATTGSLPNKLFRFSTVFGVLRPDLKYARVEFGVKLPLTGSQNASNLANDLEIALQNVSLGNKGKIALRWTQATGILAFNVYDNTGTLIESTPITQDITWNGTVTPFTFLWFNDRVVLLINNVVIHETKPSDSGKLSRYALNASVQAVGADNFDIAYIAVDGAVSVSRFLTNNTA